MLILFWAAWLASFAGGAALLTMRWQRIREFPFFCAFLLLGFRTLPLMLLNHRSVAYGWIWAIGESLGMVCLVAATIGVLEQSYARYPSLTGSTRQTIRVTVFAIGTVAAIAWAGIDSRAAGLSAVQTILFVKRFTLTALALALAASCLLFDRLRSPTPRNISRHRVILAAYTASAAAGAQIYSDFPTLQWVRLIPLVSSAACYLAWILLLSANGNGTPLSQATVPTAELEETRKRLGDLLERGVTEYR